MSKLDEFRRSAGDNIGESMGGGRAAMGAIPRVSAPGPAPKPPRLQGVDRSRDAADIEVDRIVPDPDQPREEFDPEGIARLADSLARHSQISPILVRWQEAVGKFVIVAGERRWRAAIKAGIPRLKCVIRDGDSGPGEVLAIQVIENACREDLQPIEQARAFRSLMEMHGWSQHRLAEELGIAQPSVVRALSMLTLPPAVMEKVERGALSRGTAYEISKAGDAVAQAEIAERVLSEGLTRDETVEVVRQVRARKPTEKSRGGKGKAKPITSRVFKTTPGIRITAARARGIDPLAMVKSLREALATAEAELPAAGEDAA